MSESARIQRRRNQMVFGFYTEKPANKEEQPGILSYERYYQRVVGGVETPLVPAAPAPRPPPPTPTYDLAGELLNAFEYVLQYAASNNLGPTRSSRFYYLWFFSVTGAYQWASPGTRPIHGTKDEWNWDTRHSVNGQQDLCVWMLIALEQIMPHFNTSYSPAAAYSALMTAYGWDEAMLESQKTVAKVAAHYDEWLNAYNTWRTGRAADGSTAAAVPPSNDELPNGALRLDVGGVVNPATFPHPESWTPLKIGANSQRYMTYRWEDVRSSCLTPENTNTIYAAADVYYPSTSERETEIGEVVTITNNLTDVQKVTAEFWAGGPFTVSPPGMLLWFWKIYVSVGPRHTVRNVLYSGLDMALHLFETGRIVWGLKKAHMEARPIQEIRRLYYDAAVKKYDGSDIQGSSWVPYQETYFVTPPFADFPSGHSAFSRSFALVMGAWFGSDINKSHTVEMSDITLISPALSPQTQPYGTFIFAAGASLIQPTVVPAAQQTLSWDTWAGMAESAGLSRKFGGIHATSAHTGSVAAADSLHTFLQAQFSISRAS